MTHRPCCFLVLALALGIVGGHFLPFAVTAWLWATGICVALFLGRPWLWVVYSGVVCLGAVLIHIAHPPTVDFLGSWRAFLEQTLHRYLSSEEAGVLAAIVLGDRGHIPKEINMIFRHTGTGHILVIAGLHMAMMVGMVIFILKVMRLPRLGQAVLGMALVAMYTLLTGASVPVMRAMWMVLVWLGASLVELESDSLNSLALAALIILLFNAQDLFDTSFQLSFAAVFAILLLCGPLEKRLSFLPRCLALSISVSTSAWIGITPLQIIHFGTIAPIALIANLFIVPLLDITVALGLSLALIGAWFPAMALAIAGCLKLVFNTMLIVAFWFSQIPYGYIELMPRQGHGF